MKQFFLILITVGLNVSGQLMMKQGMSTVGGIHGNMNAIAGGVIKAFLNPFVLGGVAAYGFSSVFWLILLSRVELSYAYPALALGYVAIPLISAFLLGEQVSAMRWAAVLVICVGVVLLSRS